MNSFEELEVWKESRKLRQWISSIISSFPVSEKYRLTDQILRSSRSISANIAEGFGRYHFQENIQYCRQARGSLFELLDHMVCAKDEKYIDNKTLDEFRNSFNLLIKLLNGYIYYLKKRKNSTRNKFVN